jgi:hypothetical protein
VWQEAPRLFVPLPHSALTLRAELGWDDALRAPIQTCAAAQPQPTATVPSPNAQHADDAPSASPDQSPVGQWRVLKFTNRTEAPTELAPVPAKAPVASTELPREPVAAKAAGGGEKTVQAVGFVYGKQPAELPATTPPGPSAPGRFVLLTEPRSPQAPTTAAMAPNSQAVAVAPPPPLCDGPPMLPGPEGVGAFRRVYGSAEYLLWSTRGARLPPLVTTSDPNTVPQLQQGVLGLNTTVLLFGSDTVADQARSGARFTLGWWFDPCEMWAVEGSGFFLGRRTADFTASSNAVPVITRPVFLQNLGVEGRQVTATPGNSPGDNPLALAGSIAAHFTSDFWGAEANVRKRLCCGCDYQVDLLGGFRYLDLKERLLVQEDVISLRQVVPPLAVFVPGTETIITDIFSTHNQFYGGQVGVNGQLRRGRFLVDVTGKLALGFNHETVDIFGSQFARQPTGQTLAFLGGLLATPTNIGTYSRDRFGVVPELGVKLGYQLTDQVRLTVGYTFLYWSNVVRPGDQIDRVVDANQVPNFANPPLPPVVGPSHPLFTFRETDFWAQGVNFGVEINY